MQAILIKLLTWLLFFGLEGSDNSVATTVTTPTNPSSRSISNFTEPRGKCLIRMALCLEFPNEDEGSYDRIN